jgi:hypothetical protein
LITEIDYEWRRITGPVRLVGNRDDGLMQYVGIELRDDGVFTSVQPDTTVNRIDSDQLDEARKNLAIELSILSLSEEVLKRLVRGKRCGAAESGDEFIVAVREYDNPGLFRRKGPACFFGVAASIKECMVFLYNLEHLIFKSALPFQRKHAQSGVRLHLQQFSTC